MGTDPAAIGKCLSVNSSRFITLKSLRNAGIDVRQICEVLETIMAYQTGFVERLTQQETLMNEMRRKPLESLKRYPSEVEVRTTEVIARRISEDVKKM